MKTAAEKSVAVFGFEMRKKWLWLWVLPILLCGAIFWARQAAWNRLEADFRRAFIAECISWRSRPSAEVVGGGDRYPKLLGQWTDKELEEALADVHLMHPPMGENEYGPYGYSICYGRDEITWHFYGILLEIQKDEGRCEFSSPENYQRWSGLELTPESCRALKRRIIARQNLTKP